MSIYLALSVNKWFFIWLRIELVTVVVVVLISRKIRPRRVEGIVKYFVSQAIAGVLILVGFICRFYEQGLVKVSLGYSSLSWGLVVLGLLVKIAAVPNPFWFIDSLSGLKLIEGFYLVIMSKIIPVYLYIILFKEVSFNLIMFIGVGTVGYGRVMIIKQTRVRKIVAYSSVSQLGWLLLGLPFLAFNEGVMVFVCYLLMVFPLLWLKGFYSIDHLGQVRSFRNIVIFSLIISLLSLGGLPPLIGFFYKWFIFLGLLKGGNFVVCSYLILMGLVSLFAYLRFCFYLYGLYKSQVKFEMRKSYLVNSTLWGGYLLVLCFVLIVIVRGFLLIGLIL